MSYADSNVPVAVEMPAALARVTAVLFGGVPGFPLSVDATEVVTIVASPHEAGVVDGRLSEPSAGRPKSLLSTKKRSPTETTDRQRWTRLNEAGGRPATRQSCAAEERA